MKQALMITGANSSIGSQLIRKLMDDSTDRYSYYVLLINKNSDRLEKIKHQKNFKLISCDITNYDLLNSKISKLIIEEGIKIISLIHTAAIRSYDFQPLRKTDPELWHRIIEVNINGTYNVLRCFLSPINSVNLKKRTIIFGSNVSRTGLPNGSAYSTSKAALSNLVRTIASEEKDLLINCVSPGPVETDDGHFSPDYKQFRKQYFSDKLKNIPQERLANYNDIYSLCRFLTSEENNYITGEEFFITGGSL